MRDKFASNNHGGKANNSKIIMIAITHFIAGFAVGIFSLKAQAPHLLKQKVFYL